MTTLPTNVIQEAYRHFRTTARRDGVHFTGLAWEHYCHQICATVSFQYCSSEDEVARELDQKQVQRETWKQRFPELQRAYSPELEQTLTMSALDFARDLDTEMKEHDLFLLDSDIEHVYNTRIIVESKHAEPEVESALTRIPSYLDLALKEDITPLVEIRHGQNKLIDQPLFQSLLENNHLRAQFYAALQGIDQLTIDEWDKIHEPNRGFHDYMRKIVRTAFSKI